MKKRYCIVGLSLLILSFMIGCSQNENDISDILDKLNNESAEARLAAIDQLRGNNSNDSIDAMIKALDDDDPRVQHMAILYLEELGLPAFSELAGRYFSLKSVPIMQKDLETETYIDPGVAVHDALETDKAVLVFFPEIIDSLANDPRATRVTAEVGEQGENPVYILDFEGEKIAVFHPGVGAPLAAMRMEFLIASGARKIIAVGGAGVISEKVEFGEPVVISEAIRDEGTSYHYLPAGKRVFPNENLKQILVDTMTENEMPHHIGKSWSTDAFYRETKGIVDLRRKQECLVVEMEAAAFFAIAQHRGVEFAQMVYGADTLVGEKWDERNWRNVPELRKKLFDLALQALAKTE